MRLCHDMANLITVFVYEKKISNNLILRDPAMQGRALVPHQAYCASLSGRSFLGAISGPPNGEVVQAIKASHYMEKVTQFPIHQKYVDLWLVYVIMVVIKRRSFLFSSTRYFPSIWLLCPRRTFSYFQKTLWLSYNR